MKWPKEQYGYIKKAYEDMLKWAESKQGTPLHVINEYEMPTMKFMWNAWRILQRDLTLGPDHSLYEKVREKRITPYNPSFVLYPRGCNDRHLATVLKTIARELGIKCKGDSK